MSEDIPKRVKSLGIDPHTAEGLLILPALRIPSGWKNRRLEVPVRAVWIERLEQKCEALTTRAQQIGLPLERPITPESILECLLFWFLETDGWGGSVTPGVLRTKPL